MHAVNLFLCCLIVFVEVGTSSVLVYCLYVLPWTKWVLSTFFIICISMATRKKVQKHIVSKYDVPNRGLCFLYDLVPNQRLLLLVLFHSQSEAFAPCMILFSIKGFSSLYDLVLNHRLLLLVWSRSQSEAVARCMILFQIRGFCSLYDLVPN